MLGLLLAGSLLLLALFGGVRQRRLRDIESREQRLRGMVSSNFQAIPDRWRVEQASLVSGSVVVSLDLFGRFRGGLRGLVGGRSGAHAELLDRARREAFLRMQEQAWRRGFDAVVNVRLETSRLATPWNEDGTAGVEILAYGTALRLAGSEFIAEQSGRAARSIG